MILYRYRTYENAVREIQKQTIYFADRNETNDPDMEGMLHIYWQGDGIAWRGLFKNYVCSLQLALFRFLVDPQRDQIEDPLALVDVNCFDDVPLGKRFEKASTQFLAVPEVQNLINVLEENNIAMSANDLIFVLRMLHAKGICICANALKEQMPGEMYSLLSRLGALMDHDFYEKMIKYVLSKNDEERNNLSNAMNQWHDDQIRSLITKIKDEGKKNLLHLIWDFPSSYIKDLEEFIHPKAYVNCFTTNDTDSSMWGNYADNFNGVCMIYETHRVHDEESFFIEKPYSFSSQGVSKRYQDMEPELFNEAHS